jgi:hypothetical protein
MPADQKIRLLIGLCKEFVQLSEIMIRYQRRTPGKEWDLKKISDHTEDLKCITSEFNKLRVRKNM